ncbi:hypothetical protein [Prevotella corporis]|uniref:hypothetical protein n=1 Tax=Prevotella corporis TaxID=28128 RepID=UPI00236639C1|nr:hypothetical protein [Prevotella corporis]
MSEFLGLGPSASPIKVFTFIRYEQGCRLAGCHLKAAKQWRLEVERADDKYSSNMDEALTTYEKYLQQHDSIHCLQTTDFQPYIKSDAINAHSSRNSSSFALRKVIYRISKA